jgi:hypothetical protein
VKAGACPYAPEWQAMSWLDSALKKGEDLASAAVQTGSDLLNKGADLLHQTEHAAVQDLHAAEAAVTNNVIKPVEKAVASLGEPVEHLGDKLVSEAYSALKALPAAVVETVTSPVGLLGAILPNAALVSIGYNTWKDLTNGSTVKVDQSLTANQELKQSGVDPDRTTSTANKLDLNGIFQRAESEASSSGTGRRYPTTGGGGAAAGRAEIGTTRPGATGDAASAFNLISRRHWAEILPNLTAPLPDATGQPSGSATGDRANGLPRADVSSTGIDFTGNGNDQGKLEIVNGTVFYRSAEANVEAKNGHFTIDQANGYSFKDDGNGGRVVYHNGTQVFDLHKDGTREFALSGGAKLLAQGENLTVVDNKGTEQHLTRDLVDHALEYRIGRFHVRQTAEQFAAALAKRLPSSQTVILGSDFVELDQGNATALIRDTGEAYAYTDNEVVHRGADGKWYFKATKNGTEQAINLSDLSSKTSNAELIALTTKVNQLIGNGNAEIAGQRLTFGSGRIRSDLTDDTTGKTATLLASHNESSVTDNSTGMTWSRAAGSIDTRLTLAGKQLATITDGHDDKVSTPEVVSTNDKTVVADGSVINKDMSMDLSSGIHVNPQADIRLNDGTTIGHDGVVRTAQGDAINAQAIAQQINTTMAAAAAAMASIGSGSGGASMAKIIELEQLLGSVNGLLALCNASAVEFPLATNLMTLSTRLTSTIDVAKDNYNKQTGRQFVETQAPSRQSRSQSFAYLTANHHAA